MFAWLCAEGSMNQRSLEKFIVLRVFHTLSAHQFHHPECHCANFGKKRPWVPTTARKWNRKCANDGSTCGFSPNTAIILNDVKQSTNRFTRRYVCKLLEVSFHEAQAPLVTPIFWLSVSISTAKDLCSENLIWRELFVLKQIVLRLFSAGFFGGGLDLFYFYFFQLFSLRTSFNRFFPGW